MALPARGLVRGVITVLILAGLIVTIRTALTVQSALDDLDTMIVTPVALPEPTHVAHVGSLIAPTPAPTPKPTEEPLPDSPLTILLLGTDQRPNESAARTDAIVVVYLDRHNNHVSMLSLPRDLWVEIPGHGWNRINAAYTIGEQNLGPGGGAALTRSTVGALLDLRVDYFVNVNFEGFRDLIDLVGGVEIDVPYELIDPDYPTDDYRTIRVRFPAGKQHMNGERALIYARTRHVDSDFGRNQRQQQVLMALFEQARRQGILQQFDHLDDYTRALRGSLRTDMGRRTIFDLARFAQGLHNQDIERFAITSTMIYELEPPATFTANPDDLNQLVQQMVNRSKTAKTQYERGDYE